MRPSDAQYFAAKSAVGAATAMRSKLFAHILSFGYTEMDAIGSSTLITRMTSDINQVQNGINMVLRLFLRSPFIVFGAMIMAFTIDVKAALIFVVTIPLLSIVVFTVMAVTRPIYKNVQAALDRILNITRENLTGVRVIRAFNREEGEKQQFVSANERLTGLQKFAGMISGLTNPLTLVIINLAIIVLIQAGAVRVNAGSLSQGEVVALYNYLSQILVELIKFANLIVTITRALASVSRVKDIFDSVPAMEEGEGASCAAGAPAVEFRDVAFRYNEGGEAAISGISFQAQPGQTIGIIGGTGAGKTTLINLIPRFYDTTGGEVCVSGVNVKEYPFRQLHRKIGMVPQKAVLFAGSIRDNTVRVTEGILKAEIAAQKTGLAYIGIPGVSNYKGLYQVLEQLKRQGLELVYECYDMEKMMPLECGRDYDASCWSCPWNHFAVSRSECPKKRQKRDCIRKGCLKLYEICRELDLKCSRVVWDTNADGMWNGVYKGIDDWIMWEEQNRTHFGTQAA